MYSYISKYIKYNEKMFQIPKNLTLKHYIIAIREINSTLVYICRYYAIVAVKKISQ